MAVRWAITGGTWSSTSTWNDGATLGVPTSADDVFSNGFTVNVDTNINVISLNNTALSIAGSRLNPVMVSNTSPSGVASASASNVNAWIAFDNNTSTDFSPTNTTTGWVQYQFTSAVLIKSYTIFYRAGTDGYPTSFNLQGSNDGSSWTTLDTQTGYVYTLSVNNTFSLSSNTNSYSYYRLNVTAINTGTAFRISELFFSSISTALIAGGSFNFNTSGVTANITSSSPLSSGGANLIQVTASAGTVSINMSNASGSIAANSGVIVSHTGSCNLNLNSTSLYTFVGGGGTGLLCISKTSTGTITIIGNLLGGSTINTNGAHGLSSSAGNTIIIGTVTGGSPGNVGNNTHGIIQTSGNLTITGNIRGGGGGNTTNYSVNFTGSILTINGDIQTLNAISIPVVTSASILNLTGTVSGGTSVQGISTSSPIVNIIGNVVASSVAAVISSSANIINVTGTVTASALANAISMTNANGQVYLNGNMINNNGKMAIYAPIIWLDQTGTTQARFFTSGGADRTLYSDNTFPNQPPISDVRFQTKFGPSSGLTGTLRMASPSNVRSGVATDNTVGTALFDTSQLLAELNSSSDPIAQRLRKVATPEILGQLLAAYKR